MEGGVTDGPADAVHRRSPSRCVVDHRAVRDVRDLAQDRVQVDRPVPAPRPGRVGGAVAPATAIAESDGRGDRGGDSRGPTAPPKLGRQEAAGPAPQAPSAVGAPGALHRVRHSEPPRAGAPAPPASADRAPRQADEPDPRAQRRVVCRFQGPVPDGRRAVLLSADGDRWVQPLSPGLSGVAVDGGSWGEAGLHAAVPGVRAAEADAERQRGAVRHDDSGAPVDAVGVVGAAGHPAGADRARASGAERAARTACTAR